MNCDNTDTVDEVKFPLSQKNGKNFARKTKIRPRLHKIWLYLHRKPPWCVQTTVCFPWQVIGYGEHETSEFKRFSEIKHSSHKDKPVQFQKRKQQDLQTLQK